MSKPSHKPANPCFSSGPCAKRPGWSFSVLNGTPLGRSHRAKIGKAKLKEVIDRSRAILGIPADYRIGIVPASDTGAIEMAMWNVLGARGVEMFAWESFGSTWISDVAKQLKLSPITHVAEYGELPDLSAANWANDVVFTWNGTTSGVKVPNGDWISDRREGLSICDATSAVFAMDMPWSKLDIVTWSWQKVLGGEAAHGMIVLSPKAVERLTSYKPAWPLPKIFQLTKGSALIEGIFEGETINTPSMLCVEDALDGLRWSESVGGLAGLIARSQANLSAVSSWVSRTPWIEFLAKMPEITSNTSVCLKITDPWYVALSEEDQQSKAKALASLLEKEAVAFDVGSYRDAPAGLRIWCGATVETTDVEALLAWIEWAYAEVKASAS